MSWRVTEGGGRRPSARAASEAAEATALVAQAAANAVLASLTGTASGGGTAAREVAADTITPGTRLVQLGAYDSAESARADWDRMAAQFGALMSGRARVVQEAESGGRAFWRLRAHGFADEADARQFCAAVTLAQMQPFIASLFGIGHRFQ